MNFADIEQIGLALPETARATSYGTPALKVRGKLLARLKEDRCTLVLCAVLPDERAMLIGVMPEVFHLTDHYQRYPTMLVHLAAADAAQMKALLTQSWRRLASRKALKIYEAVPPASESCRC